jgi:LacI family transcriptional regulator
MPKVVTLRDIAKVADVALSTVSQVLNNKPNVAPETREKVLQVATALGYKHRISINAPYAPELTTVGLLTKRRAEDDAMVVNPFYQYVIAGVERECQRHNINLMYANIEVDTRNYTRSWPAMLLNDVVDGVIVVGAFLEETIVDISRRTGRNIALVDAYTSADAVFDSVLIDNFHGAQTAVTHLIDNGHRHIGLIGSNTDSYPSVLERRRGYQVALASAGITDVYIEDGTLDRPDAFEATIRLLRRHPHISAIFACNDNVAIGVMNAVRQLGYRVPNDVSVVGFDDIDLAQEVMPPLTTIHVDKVLMGTMAMRMLRDRANDPHRAAVKTMVTTHLIARESVRNLNG